MLQLMTHVIPASTLQQLKQSRLGHCYRQWVAVIQMLRRRAVLIACRSRCSTLIYYGIVRHFDDEKLAVLRGVANYYADDAGDVRTSSARLRRNIHRLEKGMCMQPRRARFAEGYIGATIETYVRVYAACDDRANMNNEVRWAHSVLTKYFEIVGHSSIVDKARDDFASLAAPGSVRGSGVPYRRGRSRDIGVTYEALHTLALRRRSVRWFLPKEVPRALLEQAINIARYAPSACNRQPFEYRIFDQRDLVHILAQMPLGTSGWGHNIPVIIAVVGNLREFFSERDRHVIYIDASLSVMLLLQALETLGLSSCIINWGDNLARNSRITKFLDLRGDQRVIMLIALGFPDPDGMVPYSAKKEVNMLRRYNFEAN